MDFACSYDNKTFSISVSLPGGVSVMSVPNEVARLVNDLIQVVSCTLDGALQGQEELERQQHAIWRQEDLHLADLAEKEG